MRNPLFVETDMDDAEDSSVAPYPGSDVRPAKFKHQTWAKHDNQYRAVKLLLLSAFLSSHSSLRSECVHGAFGAGQPVMGRPRPGDGPQAWRHHVQSGPGPFALSLSLYFCFCVLLMLSLPSCLRLAGGPDPQPVRQPHQPPGQL